MDDVFQVVGGLARIRGISLVSSGDPIIHMWIMAGCVCCYTARVVAVCVLGVFLSLFLFSSSRPLLPRSGLQALLRERNEIGHGRFLTTALSTTAWLSRAAPVKDRVHEDAENVAIGVRDVGVGYPGRLVVRGEGESVSRGCGDVED